MNALQLRPPSEESWETFFDNLYAGFRSVCSIAEKRETVNELLIRSY